ncbi:hypothetical protein HYH03_007399 [Edaphochlamys debaryana]|uniref:SET domain-containing protein n=1 Tax=Edaphochlamys debaryana TaxID=47281 RepID=A0A835Y0E6_9CHLO|nr:hypothetical protein HYH03_007399 [Edaphochlamys debaryana]|eukprot:KAG2494342.1 hypothetical protein HYH03_007399 [Edaphochlamys debaryana]
MPPQQGFLLDGPCCSGSGGSLEATVKCEGAGLRQRLPRGAKTRACDRIASQASQLSDEGPGQAMDPAESQPISVRVWRQEGDGQGEGEGGVLLIALCGEVQGLPGPGAAAGSSAESGNAPAHSGPGGSGRGLVQLKAEPLPEVPLGAILPGPADGDSAAPQLPAPPPPTPQPAGACRQAFACELRSTINNSSLHLPPPTVAALFPQADPAAGPTSWEVRPQAASPDGSPVGHPYRVRMRLHPSGDGSAYASIAKSLALNFVERPELDGALPSAAHASTRSSGVLAAAAAPGTPAQRAVSTAAPAMKRSEPDAGGGAGVATAAAGGAVPAADPAANLHLLLGPAVGPHPTTVIPDSVAAPVPLYGLPHDANGCNARVGAAGAAAAAAGTAAATSAAATIAGAGTTITAAGAAQAASMLAAPAGVLQATAAAAVAALVNKIASGSTRESSSSGGGGGGMDLDGVDSASYDLGGGGGGGGGSGGGGNGRGIGGGGGGGAAASLGPAQQPSVGVPYSGSLPAEEAAPLVGDSAAAPDEQPPLMPRAQHCPPASASGPSVGARATGSCSSSGHGAAGSGAGEAAAAGARPSVAAPGVQGGVGGSRSSAAATGAPHSPHKQAGRPKRAPEPQEGTQPQPRGLGKRARPIAAALAARHLRLCRLPATGDVAADEDPSDLPPLQPGELRLCGLTVHPDLAPSVRQAMQEWEASREAASRQGRRSHHSRQVHVITDDAFAALDLASAGGGAAPTSSGGAERSASASASALLTPATLPAALPGLDAATVAHGVAYLLGLTAQPMAELPEGPVLAAGSVTAARGEEASAPARLQATEPLAAWSVLGVLGGYVLPRAAAEEMQEWGHEDLGAEARQALLARARGDEGLFAPAWELCVSAYRAPYLPAAGRSAAGSASYGDWDLVGLAYGNFLNLVQDPRALPGSASDTCGGAAAAANCAVLPVSVRGLVLPVLVALRDIAPGEQLLRDHGACWWQRYTRSPAGFLWIRGVGMLELLQLRLL